MTKPKEYVFDPGGRWCAFHQDGHGEDDPGHCGLEEQVRWRFVMCMVGGPLTKECPLRKGPVTIRLKESE